MDRIVAISPFQEKGRATCKSIAAPLGLFESVIPVKTGIQVTDSSVIPLQNGIQVNDMEVGPGFHALTSGRVRRKFCGMSETVAVQLERT
jgi:hypothetical protein